MQQQPVENGLNAPQELRIALAMRGGVSLAVWIGGACAEIDVWHDVTPAGSTLYRTLLAAAGYRDHAVIDVLSGASAGGLNGVLMGMSLVHGLRFETLRDTWMELADIRALVRSSTDAPPPISLLKGDEYFLTEVEKSLLSAMRDARSKGLTYLGVDTLDLYLAATLLDPQDVQIAQDAGLPIGETRRNAHFHFSHFGTGLPYGTDFGLGETPAPADAGIAAAAYRLALAARSSSSFPVAFEPARVEACRPAVVGTRPGAEHAKDLAGIFSEPGNRAYQVVDGGVLDNIPVARAIRAVSASPSSSSTDRWLLFLHPSPGPTSATRPAQDERANALRVATTTAGTRMDQESLLDDIAVLEEHNEVARRFGALQDASVEALLTPDGTGIAAALRAGAASSYPAYRTARGALDAERARGLLFDTVRELGEDPFPCAVTASPLRAWTSEQSDELTDRVAVLLSAEMPVNLPAAAGEVSTLGMRALTRVVRLLLWAAHEAADRDADLATAQRIRSLKLQLYQLLVSAQVLSRLEDLTWPFLGAGLAVPPSAAGWFAQWEAARGNACEMVYLHPDAGPAADLLAALRPTDAPATAMRAAEWEAVNTDRAAGARQILGRLRDEIALRITNHQPGNGTLGLNAGLWETAAGQATALLTAVGDLAPSGCPILVLLTSIGSPAGVDVSTLAALEVATFPATRGEDVDRVPMKFLRIAGTASTPLVDHFPPGIEDVKNKLAGNDLANFAAFYKRSWRANDWMWGRLDAAEGIGDILLRPGRLRARFQPNVPAEERIAAFMAILAYELTRPPMEPGEHGEDPVPLSSALQDAWRTFFTARWTAIQGGVEAEVSALFESPDEAVVPVMSTTKAAVVGYRQWLLLVEELPNLVQSARKDEKAGLPMRDKPKLRRSLAAIKDGWIPADPAQPLPRLLDVFDTMTAARLDPLHDPVALQILLKNFALGRETILDDRRTPAFNGLILKLAYDVLPAFTKHRHELPPGHCADHGCLDPDHEAPPAPPAPMRKSRIPKWLVRLLAVITLPFLWLVGRAPRSVSKGWPAALASLVLVSSAALFAGYAAVGPQFKVPFLRWLAISIILITVLVDLWVGALTWALVRRGGLLDGGAALGILVGVFFVGRAPHQLVWLILPTLVVAEYGLVALTSRVKRGSGA